MRFNSIRIRMTVAFSLIFAALTLVPCGGIIWYVKYFAESRADGLLLRSANRVALELRDKELPIETESEILAGEQETMQADNLALLIIDGRGHTIVKSQRHSPAWPPKKDDDGWRVVKVMSGNRTIVVGLPWEKTEDALRVQAIEFLSFGLFVVLAATAGIWILVGRTLRPIALLSRQAQAASADKLAIRLAMPSEDREIVELVTTLNGLLKRISEATAVKGRFYSAASHELRTPLQALSGHLELALTRDRTNAEYQVVIEEAQQQTHRLKSLVRDLLLLNQLESAVSQPPPEIIGLNEICEQILSSFAPLIESRKLLVKAALQSEANISGSLTQVQMLVRNLIENAVKYASEGGEVRVETSAAEGRVAIRVCNDFPSALQLDTERLFEPFFRPDAARNSETGGNGLGLAICKAIAMANDWEITLNQSDFGVCATVSFGGWA